MRRVRTLPPPAPPSPPRGEGPDFESYLRAARRMTAPGADRARVYRALAGRR